MTKWCPNCGSVFTNETLKFCLEDGTILQQEEEAPTSTAAFHPSNNANQTVSRSPFIPQNFNWQICLVIVILTALVGGIGTVGWIKLQKAAPAISSTGIGSNSCDEPYSKLCITDPLDGAEVELNIEIRGFISSPEKKVFLIVHQIGGGFWVQPFPTGNQFWIGQASIGDDVTKEGAKFQIMAIVDPKGPLTVGRIDGVSYFPEARLKSNIITVIRK